MLLAAFPYWPLAHERVWVQPLVAVFVGHVGVGQNLQCALVIGGSRECDIRAGIHRDRGTRLQLEDSGKLPAAAQEPQRVIGKARARGHGRNTENAPPVAFRDTRACRAACAAIASKKPSQAWSDS